MEHYYATLIFKLRNATKERKARRPNLEPFRYWHNSAATCKLQIYFQYLWKAHTCIEKINLARVEWFGEKESLPRNLGIEG